MSLSAWLVEVSFLGSAQVKAWSASSQVSSLPFVLNRKMRKLIGKPSGPGTVFMQTRNPQAFSKWLAAHAGSGP